MPLNIALFGNQAPSLFLSVLYYKYSIYLDIRCLSDTSDSKEGASKQAQKFNWKKLFPAPLLGFLVALAFLVLRLPVPSFAESTLTYIGSLTTPLSLVYIGIVLAKAGLKTIRFDKETIITLVGRLSLPVIMLLVLKFFSPNMVAPEFRTLYDQSATPALAVLPILANQGKVMVSFQRMWSLSSTVFICDCDSNFTDIIRIKGGRVCKCFLNWVKNGKPLIKLVLFISITSLVIVEITRLLKLISFDKELKKYGGELSPLNVICLALFGFMALRQ